jgi:hypothetical protein
MAFLPMLQLARCPHRRRRSPPIFRPVGAKSYACTSAAHPLESQRGPELERRASARLRLPQRRPGTEVLLCFLLFPFLSYMAAFFDSDSDSTRYPGPSFLFFLAFFAKDSLKYNMTERF